MLQLQADEKIITSVHKHWFVMFKTMLAFFILILLPPILLTFLPLLTSNLDPNLLVPATNFFLALYMIILFLTLFLFWMDYYLDMWIITDRRIIAVEQKGLFRREIAEILLPRVQDVTLEISGIIETFLKFGTIRIQTAGEREFRIEFVPNLYEAKDLILKHTTALQKNIST